MNVKEIWNNGEDAELSSLHYKGYTGSIEFSDVDNVFFGKVQGIRSLISYEGNTLEELESDFHDAIDDYLEVCKKNASISYDDLKAKLMQDKEFAVEYEKLKPVYEKIMKDIIKRKK